MILNLTPYLIGVQCPLCKWRHLGGAPAATAVRFSSRPPIAIAIGILLALVFIWFGLAIAFFSPHPVSIFITTLAFATYLVVRLGEALRPRLRPAASA